MKTLYRAAVLAVALSLGAGSAQAQTVPTNDCGTLKVGETAIDGDLCTERLENSACSVVNKGLLRTEALPPDLVKTYRSRHPACAAKVDAGAN